jgi:uncharacterized protein
MMDDLIQRLQAYTLRIFRCGPYSVHGPSHWKNVDHSAQLICREVPGDLLVVRYFAFLHDACRCDDGADLDHGPRSADGLPNLPPELAVLTPAQMAVLEHAIRHHTDGDTSDDPTIGTCWDSDRLDLGRVGIIPSRLMMSTTPGKEIAALGSKLLYMESKGIRTSR